MDVKEYWAGNGIDYKAIWEAFDEGNKHFPQKVLSRQQYLLVIEFQQEFDLGPQKPVPLFDHEAVYKTIKGLLHDIKKENVDELEYNASSPPFLYSVERGSSIYKILGELRQLLMFGVILGDEKIMKARTENMQRRIDFLKKNFSGPLQSEDISRWVTARTTYEMDEAFERLARKGIKSLKVSSRPVDGELKDIERDLIEFKPQD